MGSVASGIAAVQNPMAQAIARHHAEKMQQSAAELQSDLYLVQQGIQGNADPSIWHPALDRLTKHPALKDHKDAILGAAARLTQPQPPPVKVPVPAGPGQTNGTTTAPIGALGSDIAGGGAGPAAQPSTSPVQPGAPLMAPLPGAIGFNQPVGANLPAPPNIPPVGAPEPQPAQAGPPPVASNPESYKPRPLQDIYNEIFPEYAKGGVVSPAERASRAPVLQAAVAHNEKLRELEATRAWTHNAIQSVLGPEKPGEDMNALPFRKVAELGALGVNLPYLRGMAGLMTPMAAGLTPGSAINAPNDVEGNPIDPEAQYRPLLDKVSHKPVGYVLQSVPSALGYNAQGNQIGVNKYTKPGETTGAVAPSQSTPHVLSDIGGNQFFQSAAGQRTPISGAVNPAFAPTTSSHFMPVQTTDANGNPVTRLEPVTTQTQKGGGVRSAAPSPAQSTTSSPSAPASIPPVGPPKTSGVREFPKPFTPEQLVRHQQQLGQYDNAIDRMESIKSKLPLLNSMLESGKLQLELDSGGTIKALVNRALPMTPAESEFVGDVRTMMEDINLLRGPMGATGFRGPEAWAALQAQRGQLLANPAVTKKVLENSLVALKAQRDPIAKALGQSSKAGTPPVVNSKADYDKLPSKTVYMEDGKLYRKP